MTEINDNPEFESVKKNDVLSSRNDSIKIDEHPKKRGRPKKKDKIQEEIEQKKQAELELQKKFENFKTPVRQGLKVVFNDALFSRFDQVKPLSETELDMLSDSLIPVLDDMGWLDTAGNPYFNLAMVSFAIFMPRIQAIMRLRAESKIPGRPDNVRKMDKENGSKN